MTLQDCCHPPLLTLKRHLWGGPSPAATTATATTAKCKSSSLAAASSPAPVPGDAPVLPQVLQRQRTTERQGCEEIQQQSSPLTAGSREAGGSVSCSIASKRTQDPLLPLDVGFLHARLSQENGLWELRLEAQNQPWHPGGARAVYAFIDLILQLDHIKRFVVCYNFGEIGYLMSLTSSLVMGQLEFMSDLIVWTKEDQGRREKWERRCRYWKLAWKVGPFQQPLGLVARKYAESCFYHSAMDVFLVADPSQQPSKSDLLLAGQKCRKDEEEEEEEEETKRNEECPSASPGSGDGRLPDQIDVGFAIICQGVEDNGVGYLKILSQDAALTDEGLSRMMDFMDAFVESDHSKKGFSITYDMRLLRAPSMEMIKRIGEWGGEPEREKKWKMLNTACKVVVTSGMRFSVAKGILSTFFYICPPIVKTYLLKDPNEPLEDGTCFDPPPRATETEEESTADPAASFDIPSGSLSPEPRAQMPSETPSFPARPEESSEDQTWRLQSVFGYGLDH